MKWNEYPNTKPQNEGYYVVRFDKKVCGYRYGFCCFGLCPNGEYKFSFGVSDVSITHWGDNAEFEETRVMLKRPSNETLIRNFLNEYSGEELAKRFAEFFTDEEMKEILFENMSEASKQGLADDEWDDYCFAKDCEREDRLWRSGYYS